MSSPMSIRGEVHQNLYLPGDGREIHTVITADGHVEDVRTEPGTSPAAAEVLILDTSGSMGHDDKMALAARAAEAAIDAFRDGIEFAVVAGSHGARMIWPPTPRLVAADERTRAEAKAAVRRLEPRGGTAIGQWLRLAGELLATRPAETIRHAILLTDGRNEHESPAELAAARRACVGIYTCDCRGVGTNWEISELRSVASALHGTVQVVAEPAGLAEDFARMTAHSMSKTVAEIRLRLWTPIGATVRSIKQVSPTIEDLTPRRTDISELVGEYTTASWGVEKRDYYVCVEVEPGQVGGEKLAAQIVFDYPPPRTGELQQRFEHTGQDGTRFELPHARIRAIWTDDVTLTTRIDPQVASATGQVELAESIQEALTALHRGHHEVANRHLTRARDLAAQAGNKTVLARLDPIYDSDTGTFRLNELTRLREMQLDLDSTQTVPAQRGQ